MPNLPKRATAFHRRGNSGSTNKVHQKARWNRISLEHRQQYPICQRCDYMGTVSKVSTECLEVHHIIPVDQDMSLWDKDDNLLSLCRPCHQMYTNLESAGKFNQSIRDGQMVRDATIKRFW